jgi:hypothetical protein
MNSELKRRIDEVAVECDVAGWDGYGAKAVTAAAVADAHAFADALDSSLPAPEVGAEPDGVLTFEWHWSARQTLSVSVHGDGVLHYAALLGTERICGTEAFQARMPQVLKELITHIERQDFESS